VPGVERENEQHWNLMHARVVWDGWLIFFASEFGTKDGYTYLKYTAFRLGAAAATMPKNRDNDVNELMS